MARSLGTLAVLVAALLATAAAVPAAAQNRCADPQGECGAFVEASCLSGRVGAGTLAALPEPDDARCQAQFSKYRECLAEIALVCDPATQPDNRAAGGCAPDLEQRLWDTVKDSADPGELSIFVDTCPDSPFALIAKRRIDAAGAAPASAPQQTGIGGGDYRAAQQELRRLGHYNGPLDGDWARGSQTAMRAFQRQAGLAESGHLDAAGLAALKSAPTPANTTPAPSASPGYVGAYQGSWRNPQLGASGRSEFLAIGYDPTTGALRGRMATEYNGVVSQGLVTGVVTLTAGGRLAGVIRAPDNTGWAVTLTLDPSSSFDIMSGSFHSVPLPGTFALTSSGVFTTRRVK